MPEIPEVPVDILNWLVALLPIIALLVLLTILRWSAAQAGPVGFFVGAVIALALFQTPVFTLGVATAKGFWDSIFILYIVWTALFLYIVVKNAGVFETFQRGITEFTPNRLVQFIAFGLVFVLFLQSTAGFGTPIAVVAPLLIGLGIKPLYAVALALIGHVWGNTFGSLAISWIAMNLVVDVEQATTTLVSSAVLLAVAVIFSIVTLAVLFGGRRALLDGWPLIVIFGAIYGLGQIAIAPFIPELAAIVPATVALGAVFLLPRIPRYQERMDAGVRPEIMSDGRGEGSQAPGEAKVEAAAEKKGNRPSLVYGFIPYYGLVGFSILALALTELIGPLGDIELGFGFPEVSTGYGVVREAAEVYSGLNPIGHPGTAILISGLVGYAAFAARGYLSWNEFPDALKQTAKMAVPPSVAIIGFLTLSQVMDHSGQTFVLAQGIAEVAPAWLYPAGAVFIGIIGAFITSSNTASNVLFAPLHVQAAASLGIGDGAVLGGQMAGGAIGNAIAPANVALGTGTAGISGQEGPVLRITLAWAAAMGVLGALTILLLQLVL
jgi:lactate permease